MTIPAETSKPILPPIAYQRFEPGENPLAASIVQNGASLTITFPAAPTAGQIVGLSIGLGIAILLFVAVVAALLSSRDDAGGGLVFLSVPGTLGMWTTTRLIYLARYGKVPTTLQVSAGVVEICASGTRRPEMKTFRREEIVDVKIYSIATGVGILSSLEIVLRHGAPIVVQLPRSSATEIPEAQLTVREALAGKIAGCP